MKQAHFAGVSLGALALAGAAQAADLATSPVYGKLPVAAPTWSWTGFYIGANVGGVGAQTNISSPDYFEPGSSLHSNPTGVIGGLEAGYNWQYNNLVLGLEGDISGASISRSVDASTLGFTGDTFVGDLTALGTVRGRLGWAFDRLLIYGTGGAAFADLKDQYFSPDFSFTVKTSTATGWTAGGGVEYAFAGNWTVKAEYLHVGFSNRSATSPQIGLPYTFAFKDSLDIGRVGINYKF